MKVVWSPLALEKLQANAEYIAIDNSLAANKWVNDIFDRAHSLSMNPEIGRAVPELLGTDYREIIFGNYRIIYKIENEIKILTLRNSRQLLSIENLK